MTIKVIGAGLGRTGTMSFKRAMDILGLGPCYHMYEVIENPAAIEFWRRAGDGDLGDLAQIFAGYNSTCDWPTARWYREQAERWPDAKVVLTVRDPDAWFRSTQATIFAERGGPDVNAQPFNRMLQSVVFNPLGDGRHDRDKAVAFFNAHNEEVKRTIPADRLLVYEASQGWTPLCAFLGLPVPDEAFPLTNTTGEFVARIEARKAEKMAEKG
ncbi:MAG TPA: sulfotransferase [Caulobacteraceae bacterium]|jgi:hypothetical protein|nr:sulfotransferase [Caulobacteraceae bacterium]